MRTTPLHDRFGVEIHDVDLRRVTAEDGYPEIREAFETHSLLLFRDQALDDESHLAFGRLFGPIEIREKEPEKHQPEMSLVSNRLDAQTLATEEDSRRVMQMRANQLWHTDSTFLPWPALANILAARVLSSTGGETEFVSTRAAWADMPEELKGRIRGRVLKHSYGHSRRRISETAASEDYIVKWPPTAWNAIWPNPTTGAEALYIASHAFGVEGMGEAEGQALIEELTAFCTRPRYVYTHHYRVGDLLAWDERATMHRGRPWPYREERSLASICITAQERDGLDLVRPAGIAIDVAGARASA
jgi:alpha-ketoglutarate-dependent 2,4-dichlorophenoxyacetate dioxygenase